MERQMEASGADEKLSAEDRELLLDSFLFQGVPRRDCEPFVGLARVGSFQKGETIYTRQRFEKSVGILLAGKVFVWKGEQVVLNILEKGDCFGVASLFHPAKSYVTVLEARDETKIAFFSDALLREMFEAQSAIAVNYISFLSQRITFLNQKIDSFTARSARDVLAVYLRDNSREGRVEVPSGYSQLARQLNLGRASLYRALEQLEEEGLISRREKTILLLKPEQLI